MNENFVEMNKKAWKAVGTILRKVENNIAINRFDDNVKFLRDYCNDDRVNYGIERLVNCAYYPEDFYEATRLFRGAVVTNIREQVLNFYTASA